MSINIQIAERPIGDKKREYLSRIQPYINVIEDILTTSPHPGYTIQLSTSEINPNSHPKQTIIDKQIENIKEIQKCYPELFSYDD